ncbi:MAG TPA: 3-oxoacyl-ACP reductase family protein [Chloroflexota bacterium]|jgi:2-hydroxycyclohexanecarboxyl-CoA dehydrogenase|nr:3-oxoacyl-ACP reductase family protein [Chloroflexota bacterium]
MQAGPDWRQSLAGRVALVTGAASGIGRAIALELGRWGARVAVADIDDAGAIETVAQLGAQGSEGLAVPVDVTDYAAVQRAFAFVRAQWGPVDVLVNAAGWDTPERFVDSAPATWERVLAVNLKGVIHTTHVALPAMLERRYGRIVNIASDAGRVGSSGEAVYSAAKGGVIAFTKTIARETARQGITVNCVCPGPTETPLLARFTAANPGLVEALRRAIPMGRLGQPADIAPAVAFLASDGAAFITGQTLSVSGGLTMS